MKRRRLRKGIRAIIFFFVFAGVAAFNFLVGWLHEKTEDQLREKCGYPKFSRLIVTTAYSDSDVIQELTFDSIRDKARREHPDDDELK